MSINPVQDVFSSSVASRTGPASNNAQAAGETQGDSVSVSSGNGSSYTLHGASVGLAQLGSLLQVASSGTERISTILGQLQQLAQEAQAGNGSNGTVAQLNEDFQQLLSGIDAISSGTSFGGTGLLDGSLSAGDVNNSSLSAAIEASGQDASVLPPIPSLTAQSLFGNATPNVSTPAAAQSAYTAVANAAATVGNVSASLAGAQAQVSLASANVESALANSDASAAMLSESDFGGPLSIFDDILSAPGTSADAQTGNLPASLLALL